MRLLVKPLYLSVPSHTYLYRLRKMKEDLVTFSCVYFPAAIQDRIVLCYTLIVDSILPGRINPANSISTHF